MQITEPMTMATDYVMGAVALAIRMLRQRETAGQTAVRLWATALVMTGFAALAGVVLLARLSRPSGLTRAAGWITAGAGVSVVAGLIQALRVAPHPQFNHNDLFHVVQTGALYVLYRGGLLMRDSH